MYVLVCIYAIGMYTCRHAYMETYMCMDISVCIYVHNKYTYYMHAYIHVYVHVHIYRCIDRKAWEYMYVFTDIYIGRHDFMCMHV